MTDLPSGANTVTATFGDATDTVTFNVDPNGGIGGETTLEVEIITPADGEDLTNPSNFSGTATPRRPRSPASRCPRILAGLTGPGSTDSGSPLTEVCHPLPDHPRHRRDRLGDLHGPPGLGRDHLSDPCADHRRAPHRGR